MNEYPISPVYRVLGVLFAAALIIGGIVVVNMSRTAVPSGVFPLIIFGMIIILLGGWMLFGVSRLCVTVDDDAVRVRGARGTRELPLSEIDGYRTGDKGRFYLVRKNGGDFFIPDYISRRDDLIKWARSQYEDADVRERETETKSILQDDRYGSTEEDRKAALTRARYLSWGLSIPAIVLGFFILSGPHSVPLLCFLFVLPWIAIFLTWRSRGLIRLSVRKGTPHPSFTFMMVFTAFMVGIYAIARFHFYGFPGQAWTIGLLTALAAILLALAALRGTIALERQKTATAIFIILFAGFYGFGVAASSNCVFDRNTPEIIEVRVVDKHIHHGKSTSYELGLSPWGIYTSGNSVSVSRSVYYQVHVYEIVHVSLYPGRWGMPWYTVTYQ